MKKTTVNYILVGALALTTLGGASCNKFLDVQPKGTLTEDAQFSTVQGYYDALYGVYGTMASANLYGGDMSYRTLDKFGQLFRVTNEGTSSADQQIGNFNYTERTVRNSTDGLWNYLYRTISYANNILKHAADPTISDSRLQRVRAEAYGLRALLHLDVYRLFGPMDYETNKGTRLLPYSFEFSLQNRDVYTHEEFLRLVLEDLRQAETLMGDDETIQLDAPSATEFTANRVVHLNKYAVYALYARVYSLIGDYTRASEYATRVIGKFSLTTPSQFVSVSRFPARGEMIFGLYAPKFAEDAVKFSNTANLYGRSDLEGTLYQVTTAVAGNRDVRYAAYYINEAPTPPERNVFVRYGRTLAQAQALPVTSQGMAMIRLPEMYYIQAEALYRLGQTEAALSALNTLRASRGLGVALDATNISSLDQLKQELLLEYFREFPGEGQTFFAIKRLAIPFTNYDGAQVTPTEALLMMPRPEAEQNYGRQ